MHYNMCSPQSPKKCVSCNSTGNATASPSTKMTPRIYLSMLTLSYLNIICNLRLSSKGLQVKDTSTVTTHFSKIDKLTNRYPRWYRTCYLATHKLLTCTFIGAWYSSPPTNTVNSYYYGAHLWINVTPTLYTSSGDTRRCQAQNQTPPSDENG